MVPTKPSTDHIKVIKQHHPTPVSQQNPNRPTANSGGPWQTCHSLAARPTLATSIFVGNIKKTTKHHATDIATQMVERCWKHLNLCALESFFNFTLPNRICRLKDSRSPDPRRHTAYIPQSYASGGVSWIQPWQSLEMDWGVEDVAFESICSFNQWNFLPHP